ncbi:hypothetical protein KC19_VG170000 [Ceratodon purpureus]|uniref:Uncharacterized protein n=1 Tax=Ceratodon purpureus TaxID=3225 RepID=A0A8T0HRZ8_CERPU|nr:hypothetical protein KC19_VG170000 [Ceratodon purpureus]
MGMLFLKFCKSVFGVTGTVSPLAQDGVPATKFMFCVATGKSFRREGSTSFKDVAPALYYADSCTNTSYESLDDEPVI